MRATQRLCVLSHGDLHGEQMLSVVKCVLAEFKLKGNKASMWASGGDYTGAPAMHAVGHVWTDPESGINNLVRAIHTQDIEQTASWSECLKDAYGTVVTPCYPQGMEPTSADTTWADPPFGDIVTQWLTETSVTKAEQQQPRSIGNGDSSNTSSVTLAVALSVGAAVLLLLAIGIAVSSTSNSANSTDRGGRNIDINANSVTKTLYRDPNIASKHLVLEKLAFDRILSKGGYGEVWLCRYEHNTVVAAKRPLQTKKHTFRDIQVFTMEIQLTTSLHHPNILQFISVAWSKLEQLCMAIEYLPGGDLQRYLKKNQSSLSWNGSKSRLALDVAKALQYLHARSPAIIHRDLKSNNVLLSAQGDAKLIDFGVSRDLELRTMAAGVGTAYWTAPEIIDGTKYTEKCDMYSFGVLLSEIDACRMPYHDAVHPTTGCQLQAFQIMNLVSEGGTKPSVSAGCPRYVQQIIDACLQFDLEKQPSAEEVATMLET
ncbi:Tkl/drk protein kinase, partial [Globisporangium splendens]